MMKRKSITVHPSLKKFVFLVTSLFLFLNSGCLEEIEFQTETLESALVVSATITNESKSQVIVLSKTYAFETDGPNPETGATVKVFGDGMVYDFIEIEAGIYASDIEFAAQANVTYQLEITTQTGEKYTSLTSQLSANTAIDTVYAVRETNDDGVNGMSIYVDSFDPTGNSKYYRYEYEETYKIVPPSYVPEDLIVVSDCDVKLVPRAEEERLCFNTVSSRSFNLTNTKSLNEDRVRRHLVRFVASDNYIITTRYSILIHQFVHSEAAYNYFDTLSTFSNEGSLFSQIQPGFLAGNIRSETNDSETVIGFFDVTSVDSKRIFFSYNDFYPNEPTPPWSVNCTKMAPLQYNQFGGCGPLIGGIEANAIVYFKMNNGTIEGDPYIMVSRECGDCTALGTPEVPEFWID